MLWKYWATEVCSKFEIKVSPSCKATKTALHCDKVLKRAPWIPSYDVWAPILNLSEPSRIPVRADGVELGPGVDLRDDPFVMFPVRAAKKSFLGHPHYRNKVLHTSWGRTFAKNLHVLGSDFLYGALLRYSFDFAEDIRAEADQYNREPNASQPGFSVALHSRHIHEPDNGCDIAKEVKCFESIKRDADLPCRVVIMSDRQCTLDRLQQWLEGTKHCRVMIASHANATNLYRKEHGPFAGTGFFQDWALAATTRSAFIGPFRSSSELVLETIEWERHMEAWRDGQDPALLSSIKYCQT